jgi:hypothetical protein
LRRPASGLAGCVLGELALGDTHEQGTAFWGSLVTMSKARGTAIRMTSPAERRPARTRRVLNVEAESVDEDGGVGRELGEARGDTPDCSTPDAVEGVDNGSQLGWPEVQDLEGWDGLL